MYYHQTTQLKLLNVIIAEKNKLEIKDTCCKIRSIEMLGLTIKSVCSSPVSLKCGILEKRSGARRWLLVMTGAGETREIYMVFIGMNH